MSKRSKFGYLTAGLVLVGGLLACSVALSEKAPATIQVAAAPRPCGDNPMVLEKAQKLVAASIESGRWTSKDHDQIRTLFHQLKTEQKLEIMRKVAAAFDAKKLTVEKGAHLFF